MTLYRAMAGDASEATCAALTPVLTALADGAIGFERRRRVWKQVEHWAIEEDGVCSTIDDQGKEIVAVAEGGRVAAVISPKQKPRGGGGAEFGTNE